MLVNFYTDKETDEAIKKIRTRRINLSAIMRDLLIGYAKKL